MCYCPTPTLHLNLALTGDCAFLLSPKKPHSVWFISVLNYGDIGSVLIKHLQIVIPLSYPCHYTNLCPHKPHKPAHTHTHTHTHTQMLFSYCLARRQGWISNSAVEWACFWTAFHLCVVSLQTQARRFTDIISHTQTSTDLCQNPKWWPYRWCKRGVEQVTGEVSRHSCVVRIFLPVRYCHNEGQSSSVRTD